MLPLARFRDPRVPAICTRAKSRHTHTRRRQALRGCLLASQAGQPIYSRQRHTQQQKSSTDHPNKQTRNKAATERAKKKEHKNTKPRGTQSSKRHRHQPKKRIKGNAVSLVRACVCWGTLSPPYLFSLSALSPPPSILPSLPFAIHVTPPSSLSLFCSFLPLLERRVLLCAPCCHARDEIRRLRNDDDAGRYETEQSNREKQQQKQQKK